MPMQLILLEIQLHCACGVEGGDGNADVVQAIVDHGSKIGAENKKGYTAMSAASEKGLLKVIEVLKIGIKRRSRAKLHLSSLKDDVHKPIESHLRTLE